MWTTWNESHIYWKQQFQKNPFFFRFYADFEADKEFDISNIGRKTTNTFKNPVCNAHCISSKLDNVLKRGFLNLLLDMIL